jgi:hypothetical protein
MKSENPTEIGMHVFERAGLGKAPFRFAGFFEKKFQAHPGAPIQAGGSCDYCGTAIMGCYQVVSSDGRKFKVGCDCIEKTGDAGLIKAYRRSPEFRKKQREARGRADERVKAAWAEIMATPAACAKLEGFRVDCWKGGTEPWLAFAKRAWEMCGASGRARYLRTARKLLKEGSSLK